MDNTSFNFAAIRDTILRLSAAEVIRENKSHTLEAFVDKTSKNPTLRKQSLIYKNIETVKPFEKERLAERFLNQNLLLLINENWDNILRTNKTLRKELLDDIHVAAKENGNLCEDVNTLIESATNPNFINFEKENKAYENILVHLTRKPILENATNSEKTDEPGLGGEAWQYITKLAVSNFNKRYEHLTESEKKVFKVLISDFSEKKIFCENLKKDTLSKIENKIKGEKEQNALKLLTEFKTKIDSLSDINEKNIDSVILAYTELVESIV